MKTVRKGYCEKRVQAARRRAHIQMQQMIFLLCIFCLVMVFSCGYALASDNEKQRNTVKYYTSIEVQAGDTLWDLAGLYASEEYDSRAEYIDEVRKLNHLAGDEITAGLYLTIPYYDVE